MVSRKILDEVRRLTASDQAREPAREDEVPRIGVESGDPVEAELTDLPAPAEDPADGADDPVRDVSVTERQLPVTIELAFMFLAAVLLERYVIGAGIGFVGVEPNPLWLLIIWAAVRAGAGAAVLSAGFAGCLLSLGYACEVGPSWAMLQDPALTWPVFLFVAVAFLFGQARDGIHRDRILAKRAREQAQGQVERHEQDLVLLQHVNRELKRRIFDRSFDFQSLMLTVSRDAGTSDDKVFDGPLDMLVDFCGATKCCVLYVLPDDLLDLAAHRGWAEDELSTRLEVLRDSDRILRAIVQARPVVSLHDDRVEPGEPLMVAPLADRNGVVKAVLCIDELPPHRFDQNTVKTFLGIATWVSTNLRKMDVGEAREVNWQGVLQVLNASKSIGSSDQLSERLFLEDARRKRYGVEAVLIAVRVLDVRSTQEDQVESLEATVARLLGASIRQTDDAYRFGFVGSYVLVMTGCQTAHAAAVADRLQQRFDEAPDAECGSVDLQVYSVGDEYESLAAMLPSISRYFFAEPGSDDPVRCPVPDPHPQRSGTARDFVRRMRLEVDLARRRAWDLNVVDYRASDKGISIGPIIARHLWNNVGKNLRVTDGIYVLGPDRCVIVLPCTTCLDATRIWQRLDDDLRESIPGGLYDGVTSDFLALADTDVKDALMHLLGGEASSEPTDSSVLSETELDHLSDAMSEMGVFSSAPGIEFAALTDPTEAADEPVSTGLEWMTEADESIQAEVFSDGCEFVDEDSDDVLVEESAPPPLPEPVRDSAAESDAGTGMTAEAEEDVLKAVKEAAAEALESALRDPESLEQHPELSKLPSDLEAIAKDAVDAARDGTDSAIGDGTTPPLRARLDEFLLQVEALRTLGTQLQDELSSGDADRVEVQSRADDTPGEGT